MKFKFQHLANNLMKTSAKALASLAVVGSVAALFALSCSSSHLNGSTFLAQDEDASLRAEYQSFVAKMHRNILTKSEFEARFQLFKKSVQEI